MYNSSNKIYDGIEVLAQQALDKRTIVKTKSMLLEYKSFPHQAVLDLDGNPVLIDDEDSINYGKPKFIIYMKEGMTVSVTDEGNLYMLMDLNKFDDKNYRGWKLVAGGGQSSDAITNLDGGRADEVYNHFQNINGGKA